MKQPEFEKGDEIEIINKAFDVYGKQGKIEDLTRYMGRNAYGVRVHGVRRILFKSEMKPINPKSENLIYEIY